MLQRIYPQYYITSPKILYPSKKGIYCVCVKRITCVHYNINYCNIEGVYKFIIRPQWRIKKYSMRHFINHFLSTQLIIHDLIKTRPYLHEWNFIIKNMANVICHSSLSDRTINWISVIKLLRISRHDTDGAFKHYRTRCTIRWNLLLMHFINGEK